MDYKQQFEEMIQVLIGQGGSDLHLGATRIPTLRVNGQLQPLVDRPPMTQEDMHGYLKVLLNKEHYEHFVAFQEIDFSYEAAGRARLRGNAFVQQGKITLVLRHLPEVKTLEQLGLPAILRDFALKKQGFFLCVGPVGQGKSSTLAAMINIVNDERPSHILTIEDPVEYIYDQKKSIINQRELGVDTSDFQVALKSALRQDVNVILIGEMRNPETISTAVTAAETGHLVFSTLHTNTASQTIDRIIDSFPSGQQEQIRIQLASSLLGIFSQRLIPRITGGRVPAYELLINNNAVANLIREKRTHEIDTVIETSLEQGMIDMNRSLITLVQKGDITIEDAFLYSPTPKNLERLL